MTENKGYQTTHITPTRSYPTYQFHACTASSAPADDIFHICILETLRWLRNRLSNFSELPEFICTPEPENYRQFERTKLTSFSVDLGCIISAVYLEKQNIWTLTISENDMGANIGSANERQPVQGRRFNTEISFKKHTDHVEAGVRTVCSEPSDVTADCEVFRPTFVKKLSENSLVCLRQYYDLDGKTVCVQSRNDADRFCDVISASDFDMPVVIVCEPEKLKKVKKITDVLEKKAESPVGGIAISSVSPALKFDNKSFTSEFSVHVEKKDSGKKKEKPQRGIVVDVPKPKQIPKKTEVKEQYEYTDQKTIDYDSLADSLKCYGLVAYISEKCIGMVNNKQGIELLSGDVCVIMHGVVTENIHFSEFKDDTDALKKRLKNEVRLMLKDAAFSYGSVVFGTDARILETSENKNESMTLEERVENLEQRNRALEDKIKELENNDNGMRRNAEELRNVSRKLDAEIKLREKAEKSAEEVSEKLSQLKESYAKSSFVIDFYRKKAIDAMSFPLDVDTVCEWAEENFPDGIVIAPRARNELKKYSGSLNVSDLCDGIYYLSGYAKFRQGEITEDELNLYGESGNWETQFSGKSALRICGDDYEVNFEGRKYVADLHIKSGVKSSQLIRIYFCWAEDMNKVLIGSMPEHLGTAKKST